MDNSHNMFSAGIWEAEGLELSGGQPENVPENVQMGPSSNLEKAQLDSDSSEKAWPFRGQTRMLSWGIWPTFFTPRKYVCIHLSIYIYIYMSYGGSFRPLCKTLIRGGGVL